MNSWRERINPQPMFDVLSMARNREQAGHYVARMEIGDTPGFKNDFIHELVTKHSSSPYRYSPSRGEGVLIDKVIETQWPSSNSENIVIGPANFLITAALASKTSPGDTIMLPDPGFASYKLASDFLGLRIVYYPVYKEGGPVFPDLGEFVKGLEHRPKVVIINNPSNPLGVAVKDEVIRASLKNFPDLGIQIIFDETYVNLVYDETPTFIGGLPATHLRSFSKEHCAPGLRIGYAMSDKDAALSMADLISLSISCVPQFIQYAVADYLGSPESISFTTQLRTEMGRRLKYAADAIPSGLLKSHPNAAFYSLIDAGARGGDAAFSYLLSQNVSTCPGSKFGKNSIDSLRVSLAGPSETFERDVEMLSSALSTWIANEKL
jgi:aspartate/methionine/tyrosine aminotransferase